jgi:hypothetical protein
VEVYERETDEVVTLLLAGRLSLTACIAALDSALEDLIPRLNPEDATRLRIVMLSNNEIVMNEMERRGAGRTLPLLIDDIFRFVTEHSLIVLAGVVGTAFLSDKTRLVQGPRYFKKFV